MNKYAVVTMAHGSIYDNIIDIVKPYFESYCNNYGFDLVIINKVKIDGCAFNLEKFQIYDLLNKYDRIAYLDADVIVHPNAPNVFDEVPEDMIGAIYDNSHNDKNAPSQKSLDEMKTVQSKLGTIPNWNTEYINSGVMVVSKCHQQLFTHPEYRKKFNSKYKDQTLLNWNLQKHKFKIHRLDSKFNAMGITGYMNHHFQYGTYQMPAAEAHFIHFAGNQNRKTSMAALSRILIDKFNLNIEPPKHKIQEMITFIDIGEIGWSQYMAGHINYLKLSKRQQVAVICHPHKNVLYENGAEVILPIPKSWTDEYGDMEVEGSHLFDPVTQKKITNLSQITKIIRDEYPDLTYTFKYSKFIDQRIIKPYSHNESWLNDVNINGNVILVFPRNRPSKFGQRNISKDVWISMINAMCTKYPNYKIVSIGSSGGAFIMKDIISHSNFIDLVPYDDERSLDIMVGLCNSKQAVGAFGNITGPIKMALVCGTPTFIFGHGHERQRITKDENYCNNSCGYYDCKLPKNSDPFKDNFTVDEPKLLEQAFRFFGKHID